MILAELYNLYNRLLLSGTKLPAEGRNKQNVTFRIVLTPEGGLVRIADAREAIPVAKSGKKANQAKPASLFVLGSDKKTGQGLNPSFLCDRVDYLLGYTEDESFQERTKERFNATKMKYKRVEQEVNSPSFSAVCRFLEQWNPEEKNIFFDIDKQILSSYGVFQIQGALHDVHDEPSVVQWWDSRGREWWDGAENNEQEAEGVCLITNEKARIALKHEPLIKGVRYAQKSGAKLVSFDPDSFCSYGKYQSANAPVSKVAASAYCKALNYLLDDSAHHLYMGETTIVFWTDSPADSREADLFAGAAMDPGILDGISDDSQDAELRDRVKKGLEELAAGLPLSNSSLLAAAETRFFILGLSPNGARLYVRFYQESSLGEFLENQRKHFEGLRLGNGDAPVIFPFLILCASVRDAKEIPPLYGDSLMRAILFGAPYPDSIAMSMLRRFKADGEINRTRCAYLKAWLNRLKLFHPITPMLDSTNTEPGYLLGRLFAVLTKTQEDALPGIKRTIREAYYASASATPGSVFPRLLRLYTHHIAKLEGGRKIIRERQMQEIMSLLGCAFPARLNLREQGAFALGFYQQTQDFYTKSENKAPTTAKQSELPL